MNSLISLIFLPLFFPLVASKISCSSFSCLKSEFNIRFPFGIKDYQPESCTYPRFKLSCNKIGITTINLPNSGEFHVRYIFYQTQEMQIYDPNNCLVKRLLNFNLSNSSPFKSSYYANVTFLTCPTNRIDYYSRYKVIDCLSNSINTTLATNSLDVAMNMSACGIIGTFLVPVWKPGPYDDRIVSNLVDNDVILTWDVPNCKKCEARGDKCGIDEKSRQVVCYSDDEAGNRKTVQIFKIVSLAIAVPAITCVFTIAFIACFITCTRYPNRRGIASEDLTPEPATITITGLDETTIESYTKVTLGESKRIPGTSDGTCAICLSEFCARDMVRVIPECKHCFHTTCIDEWLRMRSTCPVCRNSPLPSPAHGNGEQG